MKSVFLVAWLMSSIAPVFPSDSRSVEARFTVRSNSRCSEPDENGSGGLGPAIRTLRTKSSLNAELIEAANAGDGRRVTELLTAGADPNAGHEFAAGLPCKAENVTALMKAVENGDLGTVKLLIESGANVNARSRTRRYDGASPREVNGIPVLMYAMKFEVTELLLDAGADPRAKDDSGFTALMSQVVQGNTTAVGLLIERGADTAARDVYGKTALDYARECGSREIVSLLKRAGARR